MTTPYAPSPMTSRTWYAVPEVSHKTAARSVLYSPTLNLTLRGADALDPLVCLSCGFPWWLDMLRDCDLDCDCGCDGRASEVEFVWAGW